MYIEYEATRTVSYKNEIQTCSLLSMKETEVLHTAL
jgi:hypothetical protein